MYCDYLLKLIGAGDFRISRAKAGLHISIECVYYKECTCNTHLINVEIKAQTAVDDRQGAILL